MSLSRPIDPRAFLPFGNLTNPTRIGCAPTHLRLWIPTGCFGTGVDVKGFV